MSQAAAENVTGEAGLASRVTGILLSPRATFAGIVAAPRWFGMVALVALVGALGNLWFLSTQVGQQAWLDEVVRQAEAFGIQVTDGQYGAYQRVAPHVAYMYGSAYLVGVPVLALVLGGILYAVFSAGFGGEATFRQVLAVVAHTGVVLLVRQVFVVPVDYLREAMSSGTSLTTLLPVLDEGSFVARLAGMVDLFAVWWTMALATGIAVLYKRKTGPIALSFFAVYGIIALGLAALVAARSGS